MRRTLITLGIGVGGVALFLAGFAVIEFAFHRLHASNLLGDALLIPLQLALYAGIVKLTERRPVRELDARACAPQTSAGFLAGILMFSGAIAVLVACGCYHVVGRSALGVIGAPLVTWTSAALTEELLLRGFMFRVVQNVGGTWISLITSSLLFGFLHAFNPGATIWSSIGIAVQAGILFGLAYTLTGRLWLPIGIHIGWNFAEGTIYGTPVSGLHLGGALLHGTLEGPLFLTGGKFGVEASIEATLVCLVASSVLYVLAARKKRIVPRGVNARPLVEAPAT
jgi:membrane protease YdiL (CAAX protease family)